MSIVTAIGHIGDHAHSHGENAWAAIAIVVGLLVAALWDRVRS